MSGNRVGSTQGRRKIPMTRIANKSSRLVTFSKRRDGLFRKASEISSLCGAEVAMIVFSPGDKIYSFGHPSVQSTINKYMGRNNHMDDVLPIMEVQGRVRIHQLNQQLAERRSQLEAERSVAKELDEMRKVAAQTQELWEVPEGKLNLEQRKQLQMMLGELLKDVSRQKTNVKEACEARKNVLAQTASSGSDGGANGGGFGESIIPQGLPSGSGLGLRNSSAGIFDHGLGNALYNTGKSVSGASASASGVESSMTPHGLALGEGIGVGRLNPSSSFVVRPVAPISSFDVGHVGPISSYGVGHVDPSSSLGVGQPSPLSSFGLGHLSPSSFGVGHPSTSSSFGVGHIGPSWSQDVGNIGRSASAPCPNDGAQFPSPVGYSQGGGSGTYLAASSLSNVWPVCQSSSFGLGTGRSAAGYSGNTGGRGVKSSMTPNGYVLGEGIGVSHLSSPSSFGEGHLIPSSSFGVGHVGPLWSNDVANVGVNAIGATDGAHIMTPFGYSQGGGGTVLGGSSLSSIWQAGQSSSFGLENSSSAVDYTSNYGASMLLQEYTQGNAGPSALTSTNAAHSMTPHGYAQGYSGVDASSTPSLFGNIGQDNFSFNEDEFGGFGMSMMFDDFGVNDIGATATDSTGFVRSVMPHGSAVGGDGSGVGTVGPTDGAAYGFPFDYFR